MPPFDAWQPAITCSYTPVNDVLLLVGVLLSGVREVRRRVWAKEYFLRWIAGNRGVHPRLWICAEYVQFHASVVTVY